MDTKQYGLDITSKTDLVGICYTMWFNAVYAAHITSNPARSCVAVKTLPKGVLVEVEVIALVE